MAEIADVVKDVMLARFRAQTPEYQLMQTFVANEVNNTKSAATAEIAQVEEAWEKKATSMAARGVTVAHVEWLIAFRDYQEDLKSARRWTGSIQSAGERMLKKVGQ